MKKNKKVFILFSLMCLLFIYVSNYKIEKYSELKTVSKVALIKKNKVGLVLGTSKYLKNGTVNLYFKNRIEATVELYKNNKIEFILISGDNGNNEYDEPTDFKNELIKFGIPENKIYLDFAGFRTLDSVIRAKEIFGQTSITIISQKFHNERAIYIASKKGINAIGYNAKDVSKMFGFRVKVREYFARSKVFIDLLMNINPKFLGNKIEIK
jgi:SanA protein